MSEASPARRQLEDCMSLRVLRVNKVFLWLVKGLRLTFSLDRLP